MGYETWLATSYDSPNEGRIGTVASVGTLLGLQVLVFSLGRPCAAIESGVPDSILPIFQFWAVWQSSRHSPVGCSLDHLDEIPVGRQPGFAFKGGIAADSWPHQCPLSPHVGSAIFAEHMHRGPVQGAGHGVTDLRPHDLPPFCGPRIMRVRPILAA